MDEFRSADPVVSCLMPTADRAAFVLQAVACFLAQDFESRELVVLDTGRKPIEHLLPSDPRIRYHREAPGRKLGELRNRACELARGEFLVHWDDDDWYPADRIARQVQRLREGAELCATSRIHFIAADGTRAWEYHSGGAQPWLAGSSFAYTRAAWQRRPFEPISIGEDSRFAAAVPRARIADLADADLVVATVHAANTSPKRPFGSAWHVVDVQRVRALQGPAAPGAPAAPARRIVIGVHAANDPAHLVATLSAVEAHTEGAFETLVIDETAGPAAAFNHLLQMRAGADVFVYLQSGSIVGPQWLARLLAALDAAPGHGLAGPTTNMAWSVQGEFRGRTATEANVPLLAREAAARFGSSWCSLAPLYGLADFCFAVRREVVAAVGGADTGFGAGPCWEMDYATRAARAGFGVVWARGAYVFRHPFTAERDRTETPAMSGGRARYQRKFCGLQLSGQRDEMAPHCRGEDCQHFAPPALLRPLRIEPGAAAPEVAAQPAPSRVSGPLVSCIMPTHGRSEWLQQSIQYFQRQSYAPRELIIVDDSPVSAEATLPCEPRIRYVHRRQRMTIGAMRNFACELARGELIAHWDDDDWYGPERLAAQVAPIVDGHADITALTATPFLDLARGQLWACSSRLYAQMFVHAVHGGTLVYAKRLFGAAQRFPNVSIAEDAAFLRTVVARGARLQAIESAAHFVYVRHGRNAWQFTCGQAFDAGGWTQIAAFDAMRDDVAFYDERREGLRRTA